MFQLISLKFYAIFQLLIQKVIKSLLNNFAFTLFEKKVTQKANLISVCCIPQKIEKSKNMQILL
jgi:hypothetical protein